MAQYFVVDFESDSFIDVDSVVVEYWSDKAVDYAERTGNPTTDEHVESSISVATLLSFYLEHKKHLNPNLDFTDNCDNHRCCKNVGE